jgi:hypothetical protein
MDKISRDELKVLLERESPPGGAVSIFMPTDKVGPGIQQNPARLKNLLTKTVDRLILAKLAPAEAKQFMLPMLRLLGDQAFWQHPGDGLAIFLDGDLFRYYRLPLSFKELVSVGDRFYIKPLIPLFGGEDRFFVLALSQNEVRLVQGSPSGGREIHLAGVVPRSLAEIQKDKKPGRALRYHSGAPGKGKESEVFYGQNMSEQAKKDIQRFFQQIDRGLHHEILTEETAPLLLAGVDYLHPIFKKVNTYRNLFDRGITGNPEGLSVEELRKRGWALVEPHFRQVREDALNEYRLLAGTGHTSSDITEIVTNAYSGKVELLLIAPGIPRWGTFHPATNTVMVHEKEVIGDRDLLDFTAACVLRHRGKVYVIEPERMPDRAPGVAIFRHERHGPKLGHTREANAGVS